MTERLRLTLRFQRRVILAAVVVLVTATFASAQRRERIVSTWQPVHYNVSLAFNDQLTEISSARTEVTVKVIAVSLAAIDFDFGDMPIDAVTISGKPARYDRAPERLHVRLPRPAKRGDTVKVTIAYHGRPKDGLIFATDRDGKASVTGDNWPDRVHHWIPCLDHPSAKASVSFTIAAPPRELAVANGKFLTMTRNGGAPSVWRFEETKPIPAYCMIIAVNEGVKIDAESAATALSFYVPHRDRSYAPKGFSSAGPALAFFNQTVAPYPYDKLALIVAATRFGGMENSSAIVFTNNLFDLRPNEKMSEHFGIPSRIERLVAHEIAHQWFGDSVTQSTWADLWLSEGFATYFAGLFIEKYEGEKAFRDYMQDAAQQYFAFEKQRNIPIYDTQTQDLMKLLNDNNYEKGSWILHMLRKRLGDEIFFTGIRRYYNQHRESNATTEDLRKALEQASRKNLRDFFSRWIYGRGHPIYEWSSAATDLRNGEHLLTITLGQKQTTAIFLDPVPVEITSGNVKRVEMIWPKGKVTTSRFRVKELPISIQIDPEHTLLREAVSGQTVN